MQRITPDPTGKDAPTPETLVNMLYGRVEELEAIVKRLEPQPHWSGASKSLVMRLRGIYAIGPNAMQMGPNDKPEFGWRTFDQMPPIQFEAAARIQELEDRLQKCLERFFKQECDLRGI
jgi:hypothetical protein